MLLLSTSSTFHSRFGVCPSKELGSAVAGPWGSASMGTSVLGMEWSEGASDLGVHKSGVRAPAWPSRCLRAEVTWGRIELVSMGGSKTGFICKKVSMWEKRSECLALGVNGALGG